MTIAKSDQTILPINNKLTHETFADIWDAIIQLKQTLLRAADYSAMIGLPDPENTKELTTAIIKLIAATAEATHKLQHHQARRTAASTAKPTSSAPPKPNTAQQHKPLLGLDTPTTAQIEHQAHS